MLGRIGKGLMALGAAVGIGVGVAMLSGVHLAGVSWIVAVGLTKLTLLASGGLMAGGAVCLRLERRNAERRALSARSGDPLIR
jgi:hypothetical protein